MFVYRTQKAAAAAELIQIKKKPCQGSKISLHVLINYSPYQKVFHTKGVYLDGICIVCYVSVFVVGELFLRKCKKIDMSIL